MPLTLSHRLVGPTHADHPSLLDIAIGLSRAPRFAGQTMQWFSVLDHTMFGAAMIKEYGEFLERAWLLHDAHEAVTGDVPSDIKGPDLKSVQGTLDRLIYKAFMPDWSWATDDVRIIKEIDARCLHAEAKILKGVIIREAPEGKDVTMLQYMLKSGLGEPPLRSKQEEHPLVKEYVARMVALL